MKLRVVVLVRAAVIAAAAIGLVAWFGFRGDPSAKASPVGKPSPTCTEIQTLTYSAADQDAARRYWTPARIKSAGGLGQSSLSSANDQRSPADSKPVAATQCLPAVDAAATFAAPAQRSIASTTQAAATLTTGFPSIGKLTFKADGILDLSCTGTVIQGTRVPNNEALVLTAAHCIEGTTAGIPYTSTTLAFSPMWHDNQSPLGVWTVRKVFLNSGWMHCPIPVFNCSTNPADDYAIIVLNPLNGRNIGNVTGADGWLVNQPATIPGVTIASIPSSSPRTLVTVSNTTTVNESGVPYRQATTPGFTDGSSGGPWLEQFNATTGVGVLIGDTGGFEQGGPSSGTPSFTDTWNSAFVSVLASATTFEG